MTVPWVFHTPTPSQPNEQPKSAGDGQPAPNLFVYDLLPVSGVHEKIHVYKINPDVSQVADRTGGTTATVPAGPSYSRRGVFEQLLKQLDQIPADSKATDYKNLLVTTVLLDKTKTPISLEIGAAGQTKIVSISLPDPITLEIPQINEDRRAMISAYSSEQKVLLGQALTTFLDYARFRSESLPPDHVRSTLEYVDSLTEKKRARLLAGNVRYTTKEPEAFSQIPQQPRAWSVPRSVGLHARQVFDYKVVVQHDDSLAVQCAVSSSICYNRGEITDFLREYLYPARLDVRGEQTHEGATDDSEGKPKDDENSSDDGKANDEENNLDDGTADVHPHAKVTDELMRGVRVHCLYRSPNPAAFEGDETSKGEYLAASDWHDGRSCRIRSIVTGRTADTATFAVKVGQREVRMSVRQYFECYFKGNRRLRYPDLPLANVGTTSQEILVPLELLYIKPGQHFDAPLKPSKRDSTPFSKSHYAAEIRHLLRNMRETSHHGHHELVTRAFSRLSINCKNNSLIKLSQKKVGLTHQYLQVSYVPHTAPRIPLTYSTLNLGETGSILDRALKALTVELRDRLRIDPAITRSVVDGSKVKSPATQTLKVEPLQKRKRTEDTIRSLSDAPSNSFVLTVLDSARQRRHPFILPRFIRFLDLQKGLPGTLLSEKALENEHTPPATLPTLEAPGRDPTTGLKFVESLERKIAATHTSQSSSAHHSEQDEADTMIVGARCIQLALSSEPLQTNLSSLQPYHSVSRQSSSSHDGASISTGATPHLSPIEARRRPPPPNVSKSSTLPSLLGPRAPLPHIHTTPNPPEAVSNPKLRESREDSESLAKAAKDRTKQVLPYVVGVVATVDANCSNYFPEVRLQPSDSTNAGAISSALLKEMMNNRLQAWYSKNSRMPSNVIYYRHSAGLQSASQLDENVDSVARAVETEMAANKEAWVQVNKGASVGSEDKTAEPVRITAVLVEKTQRPQFFPSGSPQSAAEMTEAGSFKQGLCIDKPMRIHGAAESFTIQSTSAGQNDPVGWYSVFHLDQPASITKASWKQITYNLCHANALSRQPTILPAPVNNVTKLIDRTKVYLFEVTRHDYRIPDTVNTSEELISYLRDKASIFKDGNIWPAAEGKNPWKDALGEYMFYL